MVPPSCPHGPQGCVGMVPSSSPQSLPRYTAQSWQRPSKFPTIHSTWLATAQRFPRSTAHGLQFPKASHDPQHLAGNSTKLPTIHIMWLAISQCFPRSTAHGWQFPNASHDTQHKAGNAPMFHTIHSTWMVIPQGAPRFTTHWLATSQSFARSTAQCW